MLSKILADPNNNTIGKQTYGKASDSHIVIYIDGAAFRYEDSEKSCNVTITSGDHLRKLVAKAISNGASSGKQVDFDANKSGLKISMALLQETGKSVVAHNKSIVKSQPVNQFGCFRRHLTPDWII